MMKSVLIAELHDNPYKPRGTGYNELQVKKLMRSIEDLGRLLPGVVARRSTSGDGYELACGHHRREAMRRLKHKEMEIDVINLDDDSMVHILTRENALQRGGRDSIENVAAAQRRLAEVMLLHEHLKEIPPPLQNVFAGGGVGGPDGGPAAFYTQNRAQMLKGEGLGSRLIARYLNCLREGDDELQAVSIGNIRESLAGIQKSGGDTRMLEDMQKHLTALGETDAAKLAAQAIKASKAEGNDIVEYDIACHDYFDRASVQRAFRQEVLSPEGQEYIGVDEQEKIAREIIAKKKATNDVVSANFVKKTAAAIIRERAKKANPKDKALAAYMKQKRLDDEAKDAFDRFKASLRSARSSLKKLHVATKAGGRPRIEDDFELLSEMEALKASLIEVIDRVIAVAPSVGAMQRGEKGRKLKLIVGGEEGQ
jgi:hypothetical protein